MASVFWIQEKFCVTIASQLEMLPESAASVSARGTFSDKPVVVLSAAITPRHRHHEHVSIAGRLPRGKHFTAEKSGHWVMVDEPELVVRAIEEVARSVDQLQKATAQDQSAALSPGS